MLFTKRDVFLHGCLLHRRVDAETTASNDSLADGQFLLDDRNGDLLIGLPPRTLPFFGPRIDIDGIVIGKDARDFLLPVLVRLHREQGPSAPESLLVVRHILLMHAYPKHIFQLFPPTLLRTGSRSRAT